MPYVLVSSNYPPHKRNEVLHVNKEVLKKYPIENYPAKLVIPSAFRPTLNGVESFSIWGVQNDKDLTEMLYRIANAMRNYLDIEGFDYSMDVYASLKDAKEMKKME
ncbi:MAG: hypothetical protein ACXABG_00675 [Promethearchaeota archaeon]|jgi:hypothetical protein